MTSTRWEASAVPAGHLAKGYQWKDGAWTEEPPLPDGSFGAMGGLITTGHDLARYVAFLLSAWPARDDPDTGPVRRSSVREMQQSGRFEGLSANRALARRAPARDRDHLRLRHRRSRRTATRASSCPTAAGCPASGRSCGCFPSRAWPSS